ncbi:MAG: M48 family metallopeptidase [Polyangiales bacterium]
METGHRSIRPLAQRWALSGIALVTLPAFALFFAGYAETDYDDRVIEAILADAAADPEAPDAATLAPQLDALRHGGFCAGPEPILDSEVCADYAQFAAARAAATVALVVSLLTLLVAFGGALATFLSRRAEVMALRVSWEALRLLCALEVILQAGLVVWLSFWVTAILTEKYFVKQIIAAAVIAALAVFKVVQAIFRRVERPGFVEGRRLDPATCGPLIAHVQELCAALGTAPPDQIVAGIDDNFFVTEFPLATPEGLYEGRTLYVSLPLLDTMTRAEASAVLAHEMAHFAGGDTEHSRQRGLLVSRFDQYIAALYEGILSVPVGVLMSAFRDLVERAGASKRREDEFRADQVAAEHTSAAGVGHALMRLAAYSEYRNRVEDNLFSATGTHAELGIAERVATGFLPFVQTSEFRAAIDELTVPHPYDSHPPLRERLAAVGVEADPARFAEVLQPHTETTWLDAIDGGRDLERALWTVYEARFKEAHERDLAFRYRPDTPEQEAHVLRFFPEVTFDGSGVEVTLTYAEVRIHGEDPLPYGDIESARVEDRRFGKYLDLKLRGGGLIGGKRSIKLHEMYEKEAFLAAFGEYYGRHLAMEQYQAGRS